MPKCKKCKENFEPRFSTLERYCWKSDCKYIEAMDKLEKSKKKVSNEWHQKKKVIKKSLLTNSDYLKLAQAVFNKFIRLRDQGLNCISCDKPAKKENAGHYFSSGGHGSVRFDEDNVHLQCEYCNTYLSGNLLNYQVGIERRIGGERLLQLHEKAHLTKRWSRDELESLIEKYKTKCKELTK